MSDLPEGAFVPAEGKLGQLIFEDPGAGIAPRLEFFIEIAFQPFDIDDEEVKPLFRGNNIVVPGARSWQALEQSVHEFPWAPKPGSVDGAVLLFGVHNPADVTKLAFGDVAEGKIAVNFSSEVDFEVEADRDDLEQVELSFEMALTLEPLRVATSIEKRCQGDESAITAAIAEFVDLDQYGPIEKVPGGFAFSPL